MNGINKVFLIGTLGKDPKPQVSREGKNYVTLSLATNRSWTSGEGERKNKTEWHRVTVFGRQGENCREYLRKGNPVCVEGYISTYTYNDDNGQRRWVTSITAEDVNFLPTTTSGHPNEIENPSP
jgi:single-strand DNA-binding protein